MMRNLNLLAGVLAILIVSFLSYNLIGNTGITGGAGGNYISDPNLATIEVKEASCNWDENKFNVCETVKWDVVRNKVSSGRGRKDVSIPGYYAKGFIIGGENLENSKKEWDNLFTYCQNVGSSEGIRTVHAFLFSPNSNEVIADNKASVECRKENIEIKKEKKSTGFRIYPIGGNTNKRDNKGNYFIETVGKPLSCDIKGEWVMNNKLREAYRTWPCHGARGKFESHFGRGMQFVIDDPYGFDYRNLGTSEKIDPVPDSKENYIFYTRICDRTGWDEWRSYARARAVPKENGIEVEWEYFATDLKPAIDVSVDLDCKVESRGEEIGFDIITALRPSENEEENEEKIDIEQYPVKYETREYPLFGSFWDWIKGMFR